MANKSTMTLNIKLKDAFGNDAIMTKTFLIPDISDIKVKAIVTKGFADEIGKRIGLSLQAMFDTHYNIQLNREIEENTKLEKKKEPEIFTYNCYYCHSEYASEKIMRGIRRVCPSPMCQEDGKSGVRY